MTNFALSLLSPLGRFLISWGFLVSGSAKLFAPAATAAYMRSGGLPESSLLALAVGCFEVLCGAALVVGLRTRWAALLLALFTAAASLMFHAWWTMPEAQQAQQQLLFTKNLAIFGGLMIVVAFGGGTWSMDASALRRDFIARRGYMPKRSGRETSRPGATIRTRIE